MRSPSHALNAWHFYLDVTGAMVAGLGLTASAQLAFFPDTCELGYFEILGAADTPPGQDNILKDMPVGFDFSLSLNASIARYRGPGKAGASTWEGIFYGVSGGGGPLGKVGVGKFWDPNNWWVGESVGVGVGAPFSLRTNPQTYYHCKMVESAKMLVCSSNISNAIKTANYETVPPSDDTACASR